MAVLVLDPAHSTGYALMRLTADRARADIFEYGHVDVDTSSDFQGDHCINLIDRVREFIVAHQVEHIIVEDYFFSKRTAKGCNVNAAYRTAIHICARQAGIPYTIIGIGEWKRYVAGAARPTKTQRKAWGKKAEKLMIQDALWTKFRIKFPNHSISETTGKPIMPRLDEVDAVGQAIYAAAIIFNVPRAAIGCSVVVPADFEWKKPIEHLYHYPAQ